MKNEIIYISFTCPSHIGVRKKNEAQVDAWRVAGFDVHIVYDNCKYGSLFKFLNRYWLLIVYFVFHKNPNASIYLRQTACFPLMSFLSRFRSFSYEVNADLNQEANSLPFFKRMAFIFLKDRFVMRAKKLFFVSQEIAKRYQKSEGKSYVFSNCVHSLEEETILPRGNKVVFVGSDQYAWQGVDYLYHLTKLMPEYEFHLLGGISDPKLSNVISHGVVQGDEYRKLLKQMDFAIGTLAFFRSGLNEGSPLKVRDYIRFDLPCVVSYIDTDFNDQLFVLKINVNNLSEEVSEIRRFFESWRFESILQYVDENNLCHVREAKRARLIVQDIG
jgi:hypothetical protein